MEITRQVLEMRVAGMTQQLGRLLEETAMVRGAINLCNALMEYVDVPEPEEPEPEGTAELAESQDGQSPGDSPTN